MRIVMRNQKRARAEKDGLAEFTAAKLLTKDEARRIALNIGTAKLGPFFKK
jgi:hypothetical protein